MQTDVSRPYLKLLEGAGVLMCGVQEKGLVTVHAVDLQWASC